MGQNRKPLRKNAPAYGSDRERKKLTHKSNKTVALKRVFLHLRTKSKILY